MYQDVAKQNVERQYKLMDYQAWLNGSYIVNAVQTALSPRKAKYPKEPVSMKKVSDDNNQVAGFLNWVSEYNKKFIE